MLLMHFLANVNVQIVLSHWQLNPDHLEIYAQRTMQQSISGNFLTHFADFLSHCNASVIAMYERVVVWLFLSARILSGSSQIAL